MTDMNQIIAGLIRRTEDGTLKWKPGKDDEEFTVSVDAISVVLKRLEPDGFSTGDRHQLAILNDDGATVTILETIDEFGFVSGDRRATDVQARQLEQMFAIARSSALKVEATLEQLAKALESF